MKDRARHAVVLAAGRGSRLGASTAELPKCLTEVAGRPLLDWLIESLRNAGVEKIVIITGYRAECLESYRGEHTELTHHVDWASTNMLGTLMRAASFIATEPCLITYSDVAVRSTHLSCLANAVGDIVVANNTQWRSLWEARFSDPIDDAETFASNDGKLRAIGGRAFSLDEIGGQFMGLLKTTPAGWKHLSRPLVADETLQRRGDTTQLLQVILGQGVTVNVVDCEGGWIEVDTPADRDTVAKGLAQTDWIHDWRR